MGHRRRPREVVSLDRPTEPFEPTARQLEIYERYAEGLKTLREVGKEFGTSHETVRTIVKQVGQWLRPQFMEEINRLRPLHTTRLEGIFAEAIRGWRRSCEDAIENSETQNPDGTKTSVRKVRRQSGNPVHLRTAMEALRDIRAFWGADVPPVTPPTNGQIRVAGKTPQEVKLELQRRILEALGASSEN